MCHVDTLMADVLEAAEQVVCERRGSDPDHFSAALDLLDEAVRALVGESRWKKTP